jgi:hypothetical protein
MKMAGLAGLAILLAVLSSGWNKSPRKLMPVFFSGAAAATGYHSDDYPSAPAWVKSILGAVKYLRARPEEFK